MAEHLQELAVNLVARGKEILGADETVPTLTQRFDVLHISSTEWTRRDYREMLFTFPDAAEFISGVIIGAQWTARSPRRISRPRRPLCEVAGGDPHRRRDAERGLH